MKHAWKYIVAVLLFISFSCTCPRYFTNYYTGEYTGLDTLINTQGFYCFERNDSSNTKYCIMFHNDGLFTDTYAGKDDDDLINYFEGRIPHTTCAGTYYLDKDTLKTQTIVDYGWLYGVYIVFKDYQISSSGELLFLRDYILEDKSFKPKTFLNPGIFTPLERKDHRCRYLKKKWFTGKK